MHNNGCTSVDDSMRKRRAQEGVGLGYWPWDTELSDDFVKL